MEKIDNSEVCNFSLEQLVNLSEYEKSVYNGYLVANTHSQLNVFKYPCRFDVFVIAVCSNGSAEVSSDLQQYSVKKNDIFLIGPNNIVQMLSKNGLEAHVLAISTEQIRRIHINTKNMLPLLIKASSSPLIRASELEAESLIELIGYIDRTVEGEKTTFTEDIVSGLVSSTIYKVGELMLRHSSSEDSSSTLSKNRADEYFKQFMVLLRANYKKHRFVSFYAEQMCITPKYLTTLIKRMSGRSVSDWVDDYVVLEAKTLLKYSNMSVQEISYYLNFPNQSFFGSYFKRNTGMSPNQYKKTI